MVIYEDIEDVETWLDPLDYIEFWKEIADWRVFALGDREHCDDQIARGIVDQETVLYCLKAQARITLPQRFGLKPRIIEPTAAKYLASTH